MDACELYDPDLVFRNIKLVEFPKTYVGLYSTEYIHVDYNLTTSVYLKTTCEGRFMKFEDARNLSASHRAFEISQVDDHNLKITFKPNNECISKAKRCKDFSNSFIFDIHLIKIEGVRCCNEELHSEVMRYYINAQFEYIDISHSPRILRFGEVIMNTSASRQLTLWNNALLPVKVQYFKTTAFIIEPSKAIIPPHSAREVTISVRPTCLKVNKKIQFGIRNGHDPFNSAYECADSNYIAYDIKVELKVKCDKRPILRFVESQHKLYYQNPNETYVNEELVKHLKQKELGMNFLNVSKLTRERKVCTDKFSSNVEKCGDAEYSLKKLPYKDFCDQNVKKLSAYDIFNITFLPSIINFGRVVLWTYGEQALTIKNDTDLDVSIRLLKDECIRYTDKMLCSIRLKVKAMSAINLLVYCLGYVEGNYKGTFIYKIENKYLLQHPYSLQAGRPGLMLKEKSLKFGMVTSDAFVTSVPIRIFNYFNIDINFEWDDQQNDMPFEIIPRTGTVPKNNCRICDIIYICKPSKSKVYEVDMVTSGICSKAIPVEFNIVTRKLSIKFLRSTITFKEIPLNLETIETVKLENSSREIAIFHVVEPLIPGFKIEPMSGVIKPKMLITFVITVKISCILEFNFDVNVKINNKENVVLTVSGNVIDPKIIVHPKNMVIMPRIPSFMITYVPIELQNVSPLKTLVEVVDTDDDDYMFDICIARGTEKIKVTKFFIEGNQSKTVYVRLYDTFRHEYEIYLPFRMNGFLGPPNKNTCSTELQYYVGEFEKLYENNPKVKIETINKDICYCKVTGVVTVPWILFSQEEFYLECISTRELFIDFTITNVSKYCLPLTIITCKLSPHFRLQYISDDSLSATIGESQIKFDLVPEMVAKFRLKFLPADYGRFVSIAILFLDPHMIIPYHNLTFVAKRELPVLISSTYKIIFPPVNVNTRLSKIIYITFNGVTSASEFSHRSEYNEYISIKFSDEIFSEELSQTNITAKIDVRGDSACSKNAVVFITHRSGADCELEVGFCFTFCPLTLHSSNIIPIHYNPYPYFPTEVEGDFFNYMSVSLAFLEKWMFQEGFRKDLYPIIPDTFHAISVSRQGTDNSKGINVSYMNFMRRIAGPLMKYKPENIPGTEEGFKGVKKIYDAYKEILVLLKSRSAHVYTLQPQFLLNYDQFLIYTENIPPRKKADITFTAELLQDREIFYRLNKQSWLDFILQSYKVFVMDSCFFECICVNLQHRNIVKIIINWYNENIESQQIKLFSHKEASNIKKISNLTSDLKDGIAFACAFLNYCPFVQSRFSQFSELKDDNTEQCIVNNTCILIEVMNELRLSFPLNSKDMLEPNFLQMLFLSVHLYVALPTYKVKDTILFNPPLLKSSTRQLCISVTAQERLLFKCAILQNQKNCYSIEKAPSQGKTKNVTFIVKYVANYVEEQKCILLLHGLNKTRIFDTYIVFILIGNIGSLIPIRKSKVSSPLHRPNKVNILIASPFETTATYKLFLTQTEPKIPVEFEEIQRPKFYINRLNLVDNEIELTGTPKDAQDATEHKLYLKIICLSTQVSHSWVWFRSDAGDFFIKVTAQARWDLPIDTLHAKFSTWPLESCDCGEDCECYRSTVVMVPHKNEILLKALRFSLQEYGSEFMLKVFDELIETATGRIIVGMLLQENGTEMSEVAHVLNNKTTYYITSRDLVSRIDHATLDHHSETMLALPITLNNEEQPDKYTLVFTSECGLDIRTYKVLFNESSKLLSSTST